MFALLGTELLKLRTIRWPLALLACAVALTAAVGLSAVLKAGTAGSPSIGTAGALLAVVASMRSGAIVALVAGALVFTGELHRGTITGSLLAAPGRGRLVAAKATAAGVFALAIGLADLLVALTIGLSSGALTPGVVNGDIVLRTVGLLSAYPVYAVLGVGVGAVLIHQPLAVVLPVAWYLVLEDMLVQAGSPLRPWTLAEVSAALANAGDIAGLLPVWAGALVLTGYGLAAGLLGAARLVLYDVT